MKSNFYIRLRELLQNNHYSILVETLTKGRIVHDPVAVGSSEKVERLSEPYKSMIQLFHLGQSVRDPSSLLGDELFKGLVDEQILLPEALGKWGLGGKRIVPYQGLFLFTDIRKQNQEVSTDHVWLAKGSLFFARTIRSAKGKNVLDLCTGTGIQAIYAAFQGATVTAIDINKKAVTTANWNIKLNGLDQSSEAILGDLYQPVNNEKFDLIFANPPFLPSPQENKDKFLFAEGGYDGQDIFRKILDNLNNHLSDEGSALITSGGFGNAENPNILYELVDRAKSQGWLLDLIIYSKLEVKEGLNFFIRQYPELEKSLLSILQQVPFTHYYLYMVSIKKQASGRVRILPIF